MRHLAQLQRAAFLDVSRHHQVDQDVHHYRKAGDLGRGFEGAK